MKKIICKECNKYLGEIRDAKLRKGISFLCKECTEYFEIGNQESNQEYKKSNLDNLDVPDFFKDIFRT